MEKRINFRQGRGKETANPQFLLRIIAFIIDNFLIRLIMPVVFMILNLITLKFDIELLNCTTADSFNLIVKKNLFIAFTTYLIVLVFYSTLFESSKLKATIGKWFLRFTVYDKELNRISFKRGFYRNILKPFSIATIIGVAMIDITKKRQAVHDLIAGTVVIKR
jgi:uncharacterized RDD family membrane protein YckC